jgi:RNA polymerase sigma-70 factor (ECF subfamily)
MQYTGEITRTPIFIDKTSAYLGEAFHWLTQQDWEDQLIQRAQCGDLTAFNELVLAYQDLVYRQAFWIIRERESAEDATQEVFLKAYRKIHTYQLGRNFRNWLLRIATNQCLDMIRAVKRCPQQPLDGSDPDGEVTEAYWMKDPTKTPEQVIEMLELEKGITSAIQRLSPDHRIIITLVDVQDLDYGEVSEILAIPLGTMKSRLCRARQQLRKELQEMSLLVN